MALPGNIRPTPAPKVREKVYVSWEKGRKRVWLEKDYGDLADVGRLVENSFQPRERWGGGGVTSKGWS